MEEEDVHDVSSERVKQLGFKPQREIIYNRLLPYADLLDEESRDMFIEIKVNLGKAVMLREMRPACGMWAARLIRYIQLYGLKFSKEDHIALVNLIYEVLTIPNLEPYLVNKFAQTLQKLLKKKHLLSPDEIVLEWKPLYNLCKRIMNTSHAQLGMYRYFSSLEHNLNSLVHTARFYFPVSATQEILDEFKPQLSLLNTSPDTMELIECFLPVAIRPEDSHLGYKLWFTDIMELWATCNNAAAWETEVMWLMANLASNNIGYIDWEPYIPIMFTRFLRSFNLPVSYKQHPVPKQHKMDTSAISLWIVSNLGGGSSCQKYLDKFLKSIETYFHPANFGHWSLRFNELLKKLPQKFILRLHSERYKKLTWETPTPDSKKLTEEDIDRFVESIKGIAMQSVFSKLGCKDVSVALHHLAIMRPKLIIPTLIERMYATLDSVTEPHKLTSVMQCVSSVATSLVQGARSDYPEGPTHVIPLLMSTLPGIDPNDFMKCIVTFHFITTFVKSIPIVDSSKASKYWNDLTEEEEVICTATTNFEDFVAQFLDRMLNYVEMNTFEATRLEKDMQKKSQMEAIVERALSSVCYTVLSQCSSDIFKTALKKIHAFVTERIFETKMAGRLIAYLCRAFSKVNPEETLKCFLPHLCSTILKLTESEDVQKEEILGDELLYNLLVLSEIVDTRSGILPYMIQIQAVLDRTLHLTCREGNQIAAKILYYILNSLTNVGPTERRSFYHSYDQHVKDYLPIRDWGRPGNIHDLNLKWHVPNEEEVKCVQELVSKYLTIELNRINKHIDGESELTREELFCSLNIVLAILGCQFVLPLWTEEPLLLFPSALRMTPNAITLGIRGEVKMPDGSNIRLVLAQTMDRLQRKILQCTEDDTKSLILVIHVYGNLLYNKNKGGVTFDHRRKHFEAVKKVSEDRLVGRKRHSRSLLIDRVVLQHEFRKEKSVSFFTNTHKMIMLNLLELSCSHYSAVRLTAQNSLFHGINQYSYSHYVLIPQLVENLQMDTLEHHERFKGSLYVLLGPKISPIVMKYDFEMILKMWPAIVKAKPSEKPSIVRLLNSIVQTVHKSFSTFTISLDIPDSCVDKARVLWEHEPLPEVPTATEEEVQQGKRLLEDKNKRNLELYLSLLDSLMDAIEENNLHWRYHSMALGFIRDLVHPNFPYPARVVKSILNTLINDSIALRKIAITSTVHLLKQQKRPRKKVTVNLESITSEPLSEKLIPGARPDNLWLQYNTESRPVSHEEWEKTRYVHKSTVGYYQWPRELKVYAPSEEQPPLDRDESELKPEEKEVYNFFSNPDNVAKLIRYFSLEEKKGKDKFNGLKFSLFKRLFRNHGDAFLNVFKPHLERLVVDKHESSQRCAAEIIAGIIRGSKHWPFEKVQSLWQFLGPLVRTALVNMTDETIADWGSCAATASKNVDPNRNHWLLEVLMEEPLRDESSYLSCGRLFALQGGLNQQAWRVSELYKRLLDYIRPFLNHSFQNVRERVASVLTNIFQPDIKVPGGMTLGPHVKDFMTEVGEELNVLYSLTFTKDKKVDNNHLIVSEIKNELDNLQIIEKGENVINGLNMSIDSKTEVALRLFKTICGFINGILSRSQGVAVPALYTIFPLICLLESYDQEEGLGKLCTWTLAYLAQTTTAPQHVPVVFSSIKKVAESGSSRARSTVVEFLQVFTFHNMSVVLSKPEWVDETTKIVLEILEDDRLEVREKASEVLSGLLHCDFINDAEKLLEDFKRKARVRINKTDPNCNENIRIRHCGILGLCAFISSSPYDVPDCVPEIFFILGNHLNDPQPIPSTIRKTLNNFKRTHHDNWEVHQLKFTERQLEVLSDLIVPPSYVA